MFKVGDKVRFVDKNSVSYKQLKDAYGIIISLPTYISEHPTWRSLHSDQVRIQTTWYTDEYYVNILARNQGYYAFRLILEDRDLPTDTKTKLERKCQRLWNKSKFVQKHPELSY